MDLTSLGKTNLIDHDGCQLQVFVSSEPRPCSIYERSEAFGEPSIQYEHINRAPNGERPGPMHTKGDMVFFPTPQQMEMISKFMDWNKHIDFLQAYPKYTQDKSLEVIPVKDRQIINRLESNYHIGMVRIREGLKRPSAFDDYVLAIVNCDTSTFRMIILNGERVAGSKNPFAIAK